MSDDIIRLLQVLSALLFQKSSPITLILVVISRYHDNPLAGPIAHLSVSSCLPLTVSLLLVFVWTPPHPSLSASSHFNFSSGGSFWLLLAPFTSPVPFWHVFLCSSSPRRPSAEGSPAATLRPHRSVHSGGWGGGGVLTSAPSAWRALDRTHMQFV